jgi:hypothetical protein
MLLLLKRDVEERRELLRLRRRRENPLRMVLDLKWLACTYFGVNGLLFLEFKTNKLMNQRQGRNGALLGSVFQASKSFTPQGTAPAKGVASANMYYFLT